MLKDENRLKPCQISKEPAAAREHLEGMSLHLQKLKPPDPLPLLQAGPAEPFAFALIAGSVGVVCSIVWFILLGAAARKAGGNPAGLHAAVSAGALIALVPLRIVVNLAIGGLAMWAGVALFSRKPVAGCLTVPSDYPIIAEAPARDYARQTTHRSDHRHGRPVPGGARLPNRGTPPRG